MYHESVPTPSLKCRPNIVILGSRRNGQYHQNLMQKRQNDVKVS